MIAHNPDETAMRMTAPDLRPELFSSVDLRFEWDFLILCPYSEPGSSRRSFLRIGSGGRVVGDGI